MWDTNNDHPAKRYKTLSGFFRALAAAERSGKPFRVAYTGDASPDAFEMWAAGVWEILDGSKVTYAIVEEYSDCCATAGPISVKRHMMHRRLWTQGRKYGLIIHATSQRPQLISKDGLGNAGEMWASHMDTGAAERVAKELDIDWRELKAAEAGHFWYRGTRGDAELIHVFTPLDA